MLPIVFGDQSMNHRILASSARDGSWSLERLQELLMVAESLDESSNAGAEGTRGAPVEVTGYAHKQEALIQQLLDSPAARELVAQQGATLLDTVARDAWRRGSSALFERYVEMLCILYPRSGKKKQCNELS